MLREILGFLRFAGIVGVASALVVSSASGADGQTHKICAPPGVLDASTEGIALWHDYGAYSLYRVSDAALSQLPEDVRDQVVLLDDLDRLSINGVDIVPGHAQAPSATAPDTAYPTEPGGSEAPLVHFGLPTSGSGPPGGPQASGPALHLVQFVGPVKAEWLEDIEATGATPIQYIAVNGYLVWADDESRAQLDRMAEQRVILQLSQSYSPSLKIGPALSSRIDQGDGSDGEVTVLIQMYRHQRGKETESRVEELASEVISGWTPVLDFQNIVVVMRQGDVGEIVSRPDVYWIEERLERVLMDEVQSQILTGNLNADQSGPDAPGYLPWLDSFGFSTDPGEYPIVDVTDDGIGNGAVNSGDATLHQFGDVANPTRLAYVANCTSSTDGGGPGGHGHINVSIAGGYDTKAGFPFVDPLGYQRGLGVSPYGRFAGTRAFDPDFDLSNCGGSEVGLIKSIQDNGARISSNSWGCASCAGLYDDSSQAFDAGVRDSDREEPGNQELTFIFSAGNSGPGSGTVATPSNAKNVITVGASESQRPSDEDGAWTDGCFIGPTGADDAMDVISFSSRGPSPGSRVKPEVIAPGTHVQGTASTHPSYSGSAVCDPYRPSGQTVYAASSGSSHSTPAVAGAASLAYWWMENTYGITAPSPALIKAYLIAHPVYLTGVSANDTLPSNSQGYGMPDMTAMFDDSAKYLLDQSVTFDNSGETWTWEGMAADLSKPVRIVLTYTDAPGAIGTSPQVNDLNLAATVGGATYLGNVFSGQWSTTGGAADPFNNYEAIFLPPGVSESVVITVTAFNVAGDGVPNTGDTTDQDYAVVCYNCTQTPTFTLDAEPETLDVCAPADAVYDVEVGSILGFSDSVVLSVGGNPAGTTGSFSTNPVTPPGSSTLTIGNTGVAAAGSYSLDVTGTSTSGSKTDTVALSLFDTVPVGPVLLTPADGATGAAFKPTFSWTAVAQAASNLLEVATDAGLTNIVYAAVETGTSHTAVVSLSQDTTYYWRVTAQNACGSGASTTFSFTTQASTLYCNGWDVEFEDGIPTDWTVVDNTGGAGIVWTTTADPACGIPNRTNGWGHAACADSDAAGAGAPPYDTELVTNPFDLTTWGAVVLEAKGYYRDITTGGNDRFEVDVWDGATWTNLMTWDETHEPDGDPDLLPDFGLNLSAYAGLPVVQVRFRYSGDGYDWYAQIDDVDLICVLPGPPAFEADPAAVTWSQAPDQVQVVELLEPIWPGDPPCSFRITNSGTSPLHWTIVEDDTACDSPTDVPWMSMTPLAGTTVPLWSSDVYMEIDSTGLIPGEYTANVCISTDDPNYPLFQLPVTLTVEEPTGLLQCNGAAVDFEDGIPNAWTVVDNTGGTGTVWTTTADPACGIPNRTNGTGEAACADSDAAGYPAIPYDTELVSNPIDLTGWSAVVLDVKAYYRDISTGWNDRFELDVWDGSSWTNELSWDEDHEPEDFAVNLSAYGGLPSVQLRFRYFGDGYDWYAQVDDIMLTCAPPSPPVIGVDPASLSSTQGPDVQEDRLLHISNSGGSGLDWNIVEDDTACDSPADVPWLSVSPATGATVPLDTTTVTVTIDSTGLVAGDYTASLCVNSNDPATPLVQVPVLLTVEPPVALACNEEVIGFESGIPSGWQVVDNEGSGLVWTDIAGSGESGNFTGGAGDAATASSDRFGPAEFDTELRTVEFDLTGWLPTDTITLSYLANYQNYAHYDFLDLDISTDHGTTWTTLSSWNEDHGAFRGTPGEAVSIDLAAYAGSNGLRLRWHYYDPTSGDYDWYAQIDEIALSCTHLPRIGVVKTADPDSVPEPGDGVEFTIEVTNDGVPDLTIDSLTDSDFDLATRCPDAVGTVLASGDAYTCTFTEIIAGNAGDLHSNSATATGSDDASHTDTGSDSAEVSVYDVAPIIAVAKSAPPYAYQGDPVVFSIDVTNDSVATDPVVLASVVDDIYGDVTTVHDDILDTTCASGVVIAPGDTYSCSFTAAMPGDLVGDQIDDVTVTAYDDEGSAASDNDDATVAVLPPSAATDSSLCLFDRHPDTDPREFRLLFTPDVQAMPRYKLTASNPGQFFYGAFHIGDGPATFELTLPYPFVTQGAMPVHVYSGVMVYENEDGERCFMPDLLESSYAVEVTLDDHTDTDGDGEPDSVIVTLADVPVVDGFAYLNIHLDYGLKGGDDRYDKAVNPDGTEDAVDFDTGAVLIPDGTSHSFSAAVDGDPLTGDSLVNDNEFKRMPGVAGFVWDGAGDSIEGAVVRLIIPPQANFDEPYLDGISDQDGWYMIDYKHKGRPTDFPIEVWIDGGLVAEDSVRLKGNDFVEKHFSIELP
jgi:hypothetical protein